MSNYVISFQLYGARNFPPLGAQLEALAAIGYDAVEPYGENYGGGPAGLSPAALRSKADALGLAIPSAHMPLARLDTDRAGLIDTAKTLGVETVVMPFLDANLRPTTPEGWKALGERLGEHAAALADHGLKLAWHNHDFEFPALPDGSRPLDHLLASSAVSWEVDIGWLVRAGADPAAEIRKLGSRVAAFHIKDTAKPGVKVDDGWTDVGAGIIDWKGMWPAIRDSGAKLLIVEHDNPADWRTFATNSYAYLSDLSGRG